MGSSAAMQRFGRRARPAIVLTGALGISLIAATPVADADTTPPELVDVTLSTDAVSVAGLEFETVTISVHLTDETGVTEWFSERDDFTPVVGMTTSDQSGGWQGWLQRASGTAMDGVWTSTFYVASTDHGAWHVSRVRAEDQSFNVLDTDPSAMGIVRTLEVTGTRQPQLTLDFANAPRRPGQRASAEGRLTTNTGRPISGQVIFVEFGMADWPFPGPMRRVITKADGRYHFRLSVGYDFACVHLVAPVPRDLYFDPFAVAQIAVLCDGPVPASIPLPPTDTAGPGPSGNDWGPPFGLAPVAAILSLLVLRRRLSHANDN